MISETTAFPFHSIEVLAVSLRCKDLIDEVDQLIDWYEFLVSSLDCNKTVIKLQTFEVFLKKLQIAQSSYHYQLIYSLRGKLFILRFWISIDFTISGRFNSFSFVIVAVFLRGHIVPVLFFQFWTLPTYNTFWQNCQGLLSLS